MSDPFALIAEQEEAKTLLRSALVEGPAHAYLLHGPPGVGKRRSALVFAAQLIGESRRVEQRTHPDLYLLEPVGEQIRIDDIRTLRRDLHMRPFEADCRVYVIYSAESMNREASDALLKDLEEPPAYATFLLVADELGPIPATIRSRCQLIAFHRLSEQAIREEVARRGGGGSEDETTALIRIAAGRLDRLERLLEPATRARRLRVLEIARSVYSDSSFEPAHATRALIEAAQERGAEARAKAELELEASELTKRELDQRLRRVERGAQRDEIAAMLEEIAAWYRDLVAMAVGAAEVLVHADHAEVLRADGDRERLAAAADAVEVVRTAGLRLQTFNLSSALALEALFIRLSALFSGVEALA